MYIKIEISGFFVLPLAQALKKKKNIDNEEVAAVFVIHSQKSHSKVECEWKYTTLTHAGDQGWKPLSSHLSSNVWERESEGDAEEQSASK